VELLCHAQLLFKYLHLKGEIVDLGLNPVSNLLHLVIIISHLFTGLVKGHHQAVYNKAYFVFKAEPFQLMILLSHIDC
jgi:hypothetical protein